MSMSVCVSRYVTVLVELTRIEGTKHGRLIAAQMLDVAIRVQAVRAFVVAQMVSYSDITCVNTDDIDDYHDDEDDSDYSDDDNCKQSL